MNRQGKRKWKSNGWWVIKNAYQATCEEVLGREKRERGKCWLSEETWKKIEDRRTWKRKWDGARTRKQRNDARAKYHEACKGVKRLCRRDKREHANNLAAKVETAARQWDLKTLYNISKKLSGRLMSRDRLVRNK